jgi:hypothetical protein
MLTKGQKVAGVGAVVCLLGYFMPWDSVGFLGINDFSMNGWQMTFGINISGIQFGGDLLIVLALLVPFGVGYLIFRSFRKGGALDRMLDSYGMMGIGVVELATLLLAFSAIRDSGLGLGFGWILCLLSAVVIGAGGYFNLQQLDRTG